jgi:hypothetical protein
MDCCHLRARQTDVESLPKELLEVTDSERADGQLGEPAGWQRIRKTERIRRVGRASQRREDTDRLLAEAADGEREHSC